MTVTEIGTRTNIIHSNIRQLKNMKDTLQLFVQTERSVGEPCHKVTSRMHHVISKGHVHATSGYKLATVARERERERERENE